jgi:hypothetical protein
MFYTSSTKFALYFSPQTDSWNESQLFLHSLTQNEIRSMFWAINISWLAFLNLCFAFLFHYDFGTPALFSLLKRSASFFL